MARRSTVRAALGGLGAGVLLIGAAGLGSAGLAGADDRPPGCTSAYLTGVMSGVSSAMAAYLFGHPDVNNFFTTLQGQPKQAVRDQTEAYLNANPTVREDLESIRQPSRDFRTRCNLPQRGLILADNL